MKKNSKAPQNDIAIRLVKLETRLHELDLAIDYLLKKLEKMEKPKRSPAPKPADIFHS